jgi:hypothetical protein
MMKRKMLMVLRVSKLLIDKDPRNMVLNRYSSYSRYSAAPMHRCTDGMTSSEGGDGICH